MINLNTSSSFHPACVVIKEEIEFTDLILDENGEVYEPHLKSEDSKKGKHAEHGHSKGITIAPCSVVLHRGVNFKDLSSCKKCQKISKIRNNKDSSRTKNLVPRAGSNSSKVLNLRKSEDNFYLVIPKTSEASSPGCQKASENQDTGFNRPGPKSRRNIRAPKRCVGCDCANSPSVPRSGTRKCQSKSLELPKEASHELISDSVLLRYLLQKCSPPKTTQKCQNSPKSRPTSISPRKSSDYQLKGQTQITKYLTSPRKTKFPEVLIIDVEDKISEADFPSSKNHSTSLISKKTVENFKCQSQVSIFSKSKKISSDDQSKGQTEIKKYLLSQNQTKFLQVPIAGAEEHIDAANLSSSENHFRNPPTGKTVEISHGLFEVPILGTEEQIVGANLTLSENHSSSLLSEERVEIFHGLFEVPILGPDEQIEVADFPSSDIQSISLTAEEIDKGSHLPPQSSKVPIGANHHTKEQIKAIVFSSPDIQSASLTSEKTGKNSQSPPKLPIGTEKQLTSVVSTPSNDQSSSLITEESLRNLERQPEVPNASRAQTNDSLKSILLGNERSDHQSVKNHEKNQCQPSTSEVPKTVVGSSTIASAISLPPCFVSLHKFNSTDIRINEASSCHRCLKVLKTRKPIKQEKNYRCDKCHTNYTEKSLLIRHYQRTHQMECPECRKCFTSKYNLTAHLRTHTGEKPFKCDKCEKAFTYKKNLDFHVRSLTCVKRFKCPICQKGFTKKVYLIRHAMEDHGEQPFKCEVCQKSFLKDSKLVRHMRVHSEEKPFKCDQCPSSFRWKNNLQNHMESHTGVEYVCNVCQGVFGSRYNFLVHCKDHREGKTYKCDECQEFFSGVREFRRHEKIHKNRVVFEL